MTTHLRTVSTRLVKAVGRTAGPAPRVVVSGNAAVPWDLLALVDTSLEQYRLFMLNAPTGIPTRPGVVHETPFVGPGMRRLASLRYIPSRLSQVPQLFTTTTPPDVVCLHTSAPSGGMVSLGVEVNILPAAIEAARARGALVLAQLNPAMPYTYGDAEIPLSSIDAALWVDRPLTDAAHPTQGHPSPQTGALAQLGRVVGDLAFVTGRAHPHPARPSPCTDGRTGPTGASRGRSRPGRLGAAAGHRPGP